MNPKRILISGVAIWLVNTIIGFLTCGSMFRWVYELPPTNIWVDLETMMTGSNIILVQVTGLIFGLIFASVYV